MTRSMISRFDAEASPSGQRAASLRTAPSAPGINGNCSLYRCTISSTTAREI